MKYDVDFFLTLIKLLLNLKAVKWWAELLEERGSEPTMKWGPVDPQW